MKKLVVPSLLSADFTRLADEIDIVVNSGAERLHLDIMDGHFVPNITFGPMIVDAINRLTDVPLEAHLMIENPSKYITEFLEAGVDTLMIQQETCPHLHKDLHQIKENGGRAGVVINPATPVALIEEVLPDVDHILIMTVNPGFGGQSFIESVLPKVRQTRELIGSRDIDLQVDGGIDLDTIGKAEEAGANLFVVGSSIFGEADPGKAFKDLTRTLGTFV